MANKNKDIQEEIKEQKKKDLSRNKKDQLIKLREADFRKEQYKIFNVGDTSEILYFYKTHQIYSTTELRTNNFYKVVNNSSIPVMHYALANIISDSMTNLIFSDNPVIESKKKSDTKLLNEIYDSNNLSELLSDSCNKESYSGAVAFKIVLDKDFSEYPIIIAYPKEDVEIIRKYDKIDKVIFKDYYTKEDDTYILYSIYGRGYIDYKLYKSTTVNYGYKEVKLDEVSLTEIPELSELKRIDFIYRNGEKVNKILAVYKENKPGGESDYKNLLDDFCALDEIYSNMIDFVRKSRIKSYIPESLLEIDAATGKKYIKQEYDTDNIILYDSNPEGTNTDIKRDIVDVNNSLNGYKEVFNNTLLNALSTAGLSPATVGLDMAGANSSALALNIRERVSLRTRAIKQKLWNEALQELSILLLEYYSAKKIGNSVVIDEFNDNIDITFAEYESPTYSEQVTILGQALDNNLISLHEALVQLYPDKTPEEIDLMQVEIDGQLPDEEKIIEKELESEDDEEKNLEDSE